MMRVRIFAPDDDFPVFDSVRGVWPAANGFEREAFDLYGIVFAMNSSPISITSSAWFLITFES